MAAIMGIMFISMFNMHVHVCIHVCVCAYIPPDTPPHLAPSPELQGAQISKNTIKLECVWVDGWVNGWGQVKSLNL